MTKDDKWEVDSGKGRENKGEHRKCITDVPVIYQGKGGSNAQN